MGSFSHPLKRSDMQILPQWLRPTGFLLAGLMMLAGSWSFLPDKPAKKQFVIEDNSRLFLKGTSNVNKFTCDCEDRYPAQTFEVEHTGSQVRFQNTSLAIATRKFNCHNSKMDHDMQKALKADKYPHIKIELLETKQDANHVKSGSRASLEVQAKAKLTICGVTKTQQITAKAQILSDGYFRLTGYQSILMTDFGIEPPTALFGMIQVNNQIDFHFDLYVRVSEVM